MSFQKRPIPKLLLIITLTIFGGCMGAPKKMKPGVPKSQPIQEYSVDGDQLTLTWDDTSDNELGFKIERKNGSNWTYNEIAIVPEDVNTYTDSGLSAGATHYYRVRAYNACGNSAYSNEIKVKISVK